MRIIERKGGGEWEMAAKAGAVAPIKEGDGIVPDGGASFGGGGDKKGGSIDKKRCEGGASRIAECDPSVKRIVECGGA